MIQPTTILRVQGRQFHTVSECLSGTTHLSVFISIRLSGITSTITRGLPSFRIFGNVSEPRLNPTHQKSKNLDPTQPSPTRGSTQPMDNSELLVKSNSSSTSTSSKSSSRPSSSSSSSNSSSYKQTQAKRVQYGVKSSSFSNAICCDTFM